MDTLKAILELTPNAEFTYKLNEDGTETIVWLDTEQTQPTQSQIDEKITELTSAEPLRLLRVERDKMLAETDWWALSDLTMTQAQTDYRQALRDITDTYSSLDTVVWPTKP